MDPGILSSLPTDSLYKFMALSGLTLLVLSILIPAIFSNSLAEKKFKLRRILAAERIKLSHLQTEIDDERKDIQRTKSSFSDSQANHPKFRENLESLIRECEQIDTESEVGQAEIHQKKEAIKSRLKAAEEEYEDYEKKVQELDRRIDARGLQVLERSIITAEIDCDAERVHSLASQLERIKIDQKIVFVLALTLSLSGFLLWYFKLQIYIDQYTYHDAQRISSEAIGKTPTLTQVPAEGGDT